MATYVRFLAFTHLKKILSRKEPNGKCIEVLRVESIEGIGLDDLHQDCITKKAYKKNSIIEKMIELNRNSTNKSMACSIERIHFAEHVCECHTPKRNGDGRAQIASRTHIATFAIHRATVRCDAQGHFNCHILLHRELSSSIDTRATVCFW